ncbi:MAG: penicillin-insensitive murein endopeptidase [Myxococcales bacterium]|jgi:penicillin-insensitive murein endopeptidase
MRPAAGRRRAGGVALLLAAALASSAAAPIASANRGGEINLRPPAGMRSRSVGLVTDGRLERGMRARQSEYIRYVGEYEPGGKFFGTWELVQLIERAARRVAFRLPGARLSIGELSRPHGGRIDGHRSHESGRDVDIGFYTTLPDGTPHYTYAFADFDHRGVGVAPNDYLRFDDARNWELVAKLVADGEARVQYIFVANELKYRLLREGQRRGAPRAVLERAKAVMVQPAHGHPHRNHFHVRIYCPPADQHVCKDRGPFWPWYPGTPPGGEYARVSSPFAALTL